MTVSATITNVLPTGDTLTVYADIGGLIEAFGFDQDTQDDEIISQIRRRVDYLNSLGAKGDELRTRLIGQVIR